MHSWPRARSLGLARSPVTTEVRRRRARHDPDLDELARDHAGRGRLSEPHRGVEPVGDEVPGVVGHDDVERDLGVGAQESADLGCEDVAGEVRVHVDAQLPAHASGGSRRGVDRVLERADQRRDLLVEPAALVGERDRACVAVEQPHADALLEPLHRTADARLAEADPLARAHEAAGLHDRLEQVEAAEQLGVLHACISSIHVMTNMRSRHRGRRGMVTAC